MLGKKGREAQVQMRTTNLMYNRVTNHRIIFRPINTIFWGILHRSPDQSHIIPKLFFLEKKMFYLLHVFFTWKFSGWHLNQFVLELRVGSRGRVQGAHTPPPSTLPPWDDLRLSNTTGGYVRSPVSYPIPWWSGADLGGGYRGACAPPPEMKLSSSYILTRF